MGYDQSSLSQPSSSMTPRARTSSPDMADDEYAMQESPDTLRRRTTPIIGQPEQRPTMLQEILAMLNGGQ